jgi:hypothetical protein
MHQRIYLRSWTLNPAFFISHPDVRQNASQLSMDILVSEERPIALRKSCGVDILPDALGLGMSALRGISHLTVVTTVLL